MKTMTLSEMMSFGKVVRSLGDGTVYELDDYAEENVFEVLDEDGQSFQVEEFEGIPDGWELINGHSLQCGYSGPVFHPSELIGGDLERYIRETPGDYCAVIFDGIRDTDWELSEIEHEEDMGFGWGILYRESAQ